MNTPATDSVACNRMTRKARVRAMLVCCVMALVFSAFSYRLVSLQIDRSHDFAALADQAQIFKQVIPAQRGSIRDVHGEILAGEMPMRKIIADGSHMPGDALKEATSLLATTLSLDGKLLSQKLTPDRRYLVIKHQVPEQAAEDLRTEVIRRKLHGIYFEPDSTRIYPNGSLLCHVVGFTDFGGQGIQGIEKSMNRYLEGHAGYRYITRDRSGAELVQHRGLEQEARNGYNVQLTIDLGLQTIVERELDAAVKKYAPETATAIFMRPKTGEILAMASRPYFDINERAKADSEQMKNRAIIDMIEPGSTFKIVTLSGALNEKLVRPDTTVNCEGGRWEYAGKILHDDHLLTTCTVHDVLVYSSNIGAAKLAMQLGENRLYSYIKQLGFGDRTGIDLPGEIVGMVHPTNQWTKISITRIPMGQGVAVTPIQMVMAMGAIANNGKLMMPQIIHSITDDQNNTIADFPPVVVRQVVSQETVKAVTSALEDVIIKGTAKHGAVPGYDAAGKTGTAQKVSPQGGYMSGKYVVSFVGFLPAKDPELVGMVMLDNATTRQGENYGGLVAAPIFSSIAEKAMHYLNIDPTVPVAMPTPAGTSVAVDLEHD